MIAIPGLAMRPDRGAPVDGTNPSAGVAVQVGEYRIGILHIGVTGLALALAGEGVNLGSNAATILCCIAILLLGLPHGALDLVALLDARSTARAVAVYLALAGVMAALWWAAPGAALLVFFAIAVGHFGEDWPGPGVVAHGAALALLAAPLLFHRGEIDALFAIIVGPRAILPLADSLLLVAPVAIAAGLTGCALLWSAGHRILAASSVASLVGMIMLPPLAGFALSFGLFHSPRHFARGLAEIGSRPWQLPVAAASGAALFPGIVVGLLGPPDLLYAGVIRSTFVVLSVLTVPHMLLPKISRAMSVFRRVQGNSGHLTG